MAAPGPRRRRYAKKTAPVLAAARALTAKDLQVRRGQRRRRVVECAGSFVLYVKVCYVFVVRFRLV